MENRTVITAIRGARMGYAVPCVYHQAGMLQQHFTDFYTPKLLHKASEYLAHLGLESNTLKKLGNRKTPRLPNNLVSSFPVDDFEYKFRLDRAKDQKTREQLHSMAARRFCHRVISAVKEPPSVIYGINGDCLEVFQALKNTSTRKIMEQSILPQRLQKSILSEENAKWTDDWNKEQSKKWDEEAAFYREENEWHLADSIFVGSSYVKEGLINLGVSETKIFILPYGVDVATDYTQRTHMRMQNIPLSPRLRLVYVGAISPRKGVPYLLDAIKKANGAFDLDLIGHCEQKYESILSRAQNSSVNYLGKMNRREIYKKLPNYDVMIFPSLLEGSALVTYEALACGLPVITTREAGSPIEDGVSGLIIKSKSVESILQALFKIDQDRELLNSLQQGAKRRSSFCTLSQYNARLIRATQNSISPNKMVQQWK